MQTPQIAVTVIDDSSAENRALLDHLLSLAEEIAELQETYGDDWLSVVQSQHDGRPVSDLLPNPAYL